MINGNTVKALAHTEIDLVLEFASKVGEFQERLKFNEFGKGHRSKTAQNAVHLAAAQNTKSARIRLRTYYKKNISQSKQPISDRRTIWEPKPESKRSS